MFTKPRQKKCRSTSTQSATVAIESKIKPTPLPHIGSSTTTSRGNGSTQSTAYSRSRPQGSVHRNSHRSGDRATQRPASNNGMTDKDVIPRRNGKVLHAIVGRRSKKTTRYKTYGRSSDPSYEDPSRRPALPDPYADLKNNLDSGVPLDPNAPWWLFLAEMKLQARRQEVDLEITPNDSLLQRDGKTQPGGSAETGLAEVTKIKRADTKPDLTRPDRSQERASDRLSCKAEEDIRRHCTNQGEGGSDTKTRESLPDDDTKNVDDADADDNDNEEDEDEEDESGLPQAVLAMTPSCSLPNAREVVRERHKAMMEEIARAVRPTRLLPNLRTQGFFNYDYTPHARTNLTNHNLRKGKKKGIERLYLLLACRTSKCMGELFGTALP